MAPRRTPLPLLLHLPHLLLLLTTLLLLLPLPTHARPIGPHDLRQTVRNYLENGGHDRIRRALDLAPGIYYDPLRFFTRESVYITKDGTTINQHPQAHKVSDFALLRAMRLHIPGVDAESDLPTFRQRIRQTTNVGINRSGPPVLVVGERSEITVLYSDDTPSQARRAVEFAVRKWADMFESRVRLRIRFDWRQLEPATLGAATSPFYLSSVGRESLRDDAVYSLALASALEENDLIDGSDSHVHLMLNRGINWHYDIGSEAPFEKYDLSTTVLHELTHGLFFAGTVQGNRAQETAMYVEMAPGRFDQFARVDGNVGVARGCTRQEDLYNAITNPTLRFVDANTRSNFGLFAPVAFIRGSSMYHFNNTDDLERDCAASGISDIECSDLMTHELQNGYTQRNLGETTMRIYNAMRSQRAGLPAGAECDLPDSATLVSSDPESFNENGPENANVGTSTPFTLPLWGIVTVAVLGGLGAILVFGVVVSSISSRG